MPASEAERRDAILIKPDGTKPGLLNGKSRKNLCGLAPDEHGGADAQRQLRARSSHECERETGLASAKPDSKGSDRGLWC